MGADILQEKPTRAVPAWVPVFFLVVAAVFIVKIGWIADGGFELLRTIVNGVSGWGPSFNPAEPAYDLQSPLWFMVWSAIGAVTGEWVTTILAVSFSLSLVAFGVVLYRARSLAALVGAAAALLLSNAFMQFTSSGLEQPLVFVLLAALVFSAHALLRGGSANTAALVGLVGSLTTLAQPTLGLFVIPVLGFMAWTQRRDGAVVFTMLSMFGLPLAIWSSWAYSEYATLIPESFSRAFALPFAESVSAGAGYLWDSLRADPVTLTVMVVGVAVLLVKGAGLHRCVATGVLTYLLWITATGANEVPGQLLAAPLFVTVLGLVDWFTPADVSRKAQARWANIAADLSLVVLAVLVLTAPSPTIVDAWLETPENTATEWAAAAAGNSTFVDLVGGTTGDVIEYTPFQPPNVLLRYDGPFTITSMREAANEWPIDDNDAVVSEPVPSPCGRRGGNGMMSGPEVQWTDTCPVK